MELTHIIKKGDTLRSISSKYNLADWRILADYNNLDYPFLSDEEHLTKNVKKTGDTIIIPIDEPSRVRTEDTIINQEEAIFGLDILLTPSLETAKGLRDLSIGGEITGYLGDVKTSRGVDNLAQAITHRLMTSYGELPLHPEYGCNIKKVVGKGATFKEITKAKLEVTRACKQDPRVKEVSRVNVRFENQAMFISCYIQTINGEGFTLETSL